MGVHGLWDLLSPVGRRVSVETLAGKRLAIDASIWMVQFMKAMRDEKGEMIRNAHLLGFFRRICKLLYLRTKPVFVFDGGTPALKRRTVIARRRQRENAQAKIRKTAEKLLLNQLKQVRLRELADDLEKQRSKVDKGKKIATDETDVAGSASTGTKSFADSCNQEAFDEMLAASLAAEEGGGFGAAQTSSALPNPDQDEDADEDEDEEMILPTFEGKIDPAILAALPPSMQLDLLVQMRERLMAENRKKYQRVKKAPARFSELQIQSYLKTVAFRREIDEVQKAAAGRGIGGVQTSRIASEANREFIFSSNYTGDKLDLAPTGEGMKTNDQSRAPIVNTSKSSVNNTPSSEKEAMKTNDQSRAPIISTSGSAVNNTPSSEKSQAVSGVSTDEPEKDPKNDVETYLDERGRVRVSRVRAMGIHMTRDLQRNLDLMKEIEEDRIGDTIELNNQIDYRATLGNSSGDHSSQASDENLCGVTSENATKEETLLNAETAMEISFEGKDPYECGHEEDDLFTQLVAGNPVLDFSIDNSLSNKQSSDSASELEWEEGEGVALSHEGDPKGKSPQVDGLSMEEDLEWEEGSLETREEASSLPDEHKRVVSKGSLVEETELQEAIRRSLQDLEHRISVDEPVEHEKSRKTVEVAVDDGFSNIEWEATPSRLSGIPQSDSLGNFPSNSRGDATVAEMSGDRQIGGVEVLPVKECQTNLQNINQHVDGKCSLVPELCESGTSVQHSSFQEPLTQASVNGDMGTADGHSKWTAESEKSSEKYPVKEVDVTQESEEKEIHQHFLNLGQEPLNKVSSKEDIDVTRANLEAEMLMLDEEYKQLGDKQRKLERNAESVNNEVFAECQELLQMFGLPYIIAPMEAEAQCAYMELVDLVDGVVTDDSDVFLFGARNVYKNIFDERKYVETYFMKDIESELGLSREKLVRMAMLLGSDYTEGISGIGIVNAIEVVNAFPEEDGLRKFREWIESPDPSILGTGLKQRESPSSAGDNSVNSSRADGDISGSGDNIQMKRQFMDRHRNVSKNWHIPSSFPSDAVILAYSSPQVDRSTAPFSWGKPDHYVLRKLCWEKFGWNLQKSDELLLPVLTEYNKRETQLRMEAFYTFNERFAKIRSKRIKKAVKGITGSTSSQLIDESVQDDATGTSTKKTTKRKGSTKVSESGNSLSTEGEICQSRSRKANVKRKCGAGATGTSSTKRARRKVNPSPKLASSSSDDENTDEREQHPQVGPAEPYQIRRSGRPRKEVNYALDDMEFDNPNQDEGNPANQNASGEEPFSEGLEVPSNMQATEHSVDYVSFPLDEVKDQVSSCPTADCPTNSQLSEDYLAMGGGFCAEEDGKDGDAQGDLPNSSILGEDEDTVIPTRGRSSSEEAQNTNENNISLSEQSMDGDDSSKGLLRPLSAMPNLKRKRRKN